MKIEAFDGVGLRPYPVAHLSAVENAGGDVAVSWIRRTRIDGDSWQSSEVPLGETTESYVVRVVQADVILREEIVPTSAWVYPVVAQSSDGITGVYSIEVAQISDRFGPGPFRSLLIAA